MIISTTAIKTVQFDKYFFLGLAGCILTFAVSYPAIYSNFRRLTKDFIRFYDGVFLAAMFVVCFKINLYTGFISIAAFLIMRYTYNKKRGGERICKCCNELVEGKTCSGYIQQKQALLNLEEEYSNIVTKWVMNRKDFKL